MSPDDRSWRCFHCDALFTDSARAREHFGPTEFDKPACQIDATHLRWLEEQHRRNVDEDSDALRAVRSLASEHETLRRRAEQLGYERGLADARRHPHELGLVAAEDHRHTQQRVEDLRAIAKQGAKYITEEDVAAIAAIPESELRRHYLRQMDWHRHFAHSLDGIEAIRFMPGAAPDGCWSHREVRSVVLRLVEQLPSLPGAPT